MCSLDVWSSNWILDTFKAIPDRLLLIDGFWAVLEFKDSRNAPHQPNQDWYIEKFKRDVFRLFCVSRKC
jgi:hypothetical protein